MSRLFDDGSSEYLQINQAVRSTYPFAMVCLFNSNDETVKQTLMCLADKDVLLDWFTLVADSDGTLKTYAQHNDDYLRVISTTNWSGNTWHHACGLFVSSTDVRVLLDAGGKHVDTAPATNPANIDSTTIGRNTRSTPAFYMSGMVAEAAIYDLSVWPGATASDKADNFEKILPSLAKGATPDTYPLGLVGYWPLIRGINDKFGGYNLTASGTAAAAHPPVILPQKPWIPQPYRINVTVTPQPLALNLELLAPTAYHIVTVTPSTLELNLALLAPTLAYDYTVTPATLELTLALLAPTFAYDYTVTPATLELALALLPPTIVIPTDVTVLVETLQLTLALLAPEVVTRFVEIPPFMEKDLIDRYSGGAWLWLYEISVPGYVTQRAARNTEGIVYGGIAFPKGNFKLGRQSLAGDASVPRVILQVAQDREKVLEKIVNATKGCANGTVKIIRTCEKFLETPVDALEATYSVLTAGSDFQWVTFVLGIPNPLTQRIPLWLYSSKVCPLATPSLFKGPRCQYAGPDTVCTGLFEDCYLKGNAVHWGAEMGLDPNAVRV